MTATVSVAPGTEKVVRLLQSFTPLILRKNWLIRV
jgi:hypothetical protein